jgi:hypothetical protein
MSMEYHVGSVGVEPMTQAQRRQLFFIGLGMYGAILVINLAFLVTFESSPTRFATVRILALVLTVLFTVADTVLLRGVCKKQYPAYTDLLDKWPFNVAEYPTWIYSAFVVLSYATSAYLISRI